MDSTNNNSGVVNGIVEGFGMGILVVGTAAAIAGVVALWNGTGKTADKRIAAAHEGGLQHAGWATAELATLAASATATFLSAQLMDPSSVSAGAIDFPLLSTTLGAAGAAIGALPAIHIVKAEINDAFKHATDHFPLKALGRKLGIGVLALSTMYATPGVVDYMNTPAADHTQTLVETVSHGPNAQSLSTLVDNIAHYAFANDFSKAAAIQHIANYDLNEVAKTNLKLAMDAAISTAPSTFFPETPNVLTAHENANMVHFIADHLSQYNRVEGTDAGIITNMLNRSVNAPALHTYALKAAIEALDETRVSPAEMPRMIQAIAPHVKNGSAEAAHLKSAAEFAAQNITFDKAELVDSNYWVPEAKAQAFSYVKDLTVAGSAENQKATADYNSYLKWAAHNGGHLRVDSDDTWHIRPGSALHQQNTQGPDFHSQLRVVYGPSAAGLSS